jgi:hypothetical protein
MSSGRNIVAPVRINVRQDSGSDQEEYYLGSVEPPKVNGIPIYTSDEEFLGKWSPAGKPINIHDALNDLWAEWREAVEEPDSDSEFVDWLVDKKGWSRFTDNFPVCHTIVT